jgi:hypothetical protein
LLGLPLEKKVDHAIKLPLGAIPVSYVPYRHYLLENNELETQIKEILEKWHIQSKNFP